jgi:hypothetical protein
VIVWLCGGIDVSGGGTGLVRLELMKMMWVEEPGEGKYGHLVCVKWLSVTDSMVKCVSLYPGNPGFNFRLAYRLSRTLSCLVSVLGKFRENSSDFGITICFRIFSNSFFLTCCMI